MRPKSRTVVIGTNKDVDLTRHNEATGITTEKFVQKSVVQKTTQPESGEAIENVELPEVSIQHTAPISSENIHLKKPTEMECSDMKSSTTHEKNDSLSETGAIPSEVQQTVCDTEINVTKVNTKALLNTGTKNTKHVSEILSSKEAERILISNTAKPIKTRKIFVFLMVPFLLLTALAVSMMLSDIHMLSVVCFLGIPTAMFAVLSRSPKYTKYILGRDKGLKKGLFVVLCLVAMIVVPIIVSILMI